MTTAVTGPLFVKPPEAARILGVSKATVYRWAREGTIPARKIGGTVLVSVEMLRRLSDPDDGAAA